MNLTKGLVTIALPADLSWADEFDWSTVAAADTRTIGGRISRQTATRIAGRPITLTPPAPDQCPVSLETVRTLRGWTDDPAAEMTLEFSEAESYPVRWRYEGDRGPVEATPMLGFTNRDVAEIWRVTLRLITVEE